MPVSTKPKSDAVLLPTRKTWGVVRVGKKGRPRAGYVPCLFGTREDARYGCDYDEVVVQVEYTIVRVERA